MFNPDRTQDDAVAPFASPRAHDLLGRPEIAALREQFPEHDAQLRSCVELLSREDADLDHVAAGVRKSFLANTEKLKIFVSYKRTQHAQAALKLQQALQALGGNRVNVFLDQATIPYGQQWYATIKQNLQRANCFILLVPDESDEREWPIFEAGIFAGKMLPGDRLICLHHRDVSVPKQLEAFQGIEADELGVTRLLRLVLVEPNLVPGLPAINAGAEQLLAGQADQIVKLIAGPTRLRSRPTMPFVTLGLTTPGQVTGMEDLLEARVLDARGLEEMFEYAGGVGCEFREVVEVAEGGLERHLPWLTEIADVVCREVRRHRAPVPFAKFATPDGSRFFRPVMRKVEEDAHGVVHRIELVFGEHLAGCVGQPDDLKLLETAMRLSARFRAEVLVRYRNATSAHDVQSAERILQRMERESQEEGLRDREIMIGLFAGDDCRQVGDIYDRWEGYRNARQTGRLDLALARRDPSQLRQCIKDIRLMSRDFMILAAARYAELVRTADF